MAESGADSVQEWINGSLTEGAGATSEWYILALSQSRVSYDFSGYEVALTAYLDDTDTSSASTRLKYALVLAAIGSEDAYISEALGNSIGQQGLMSWVYGLHMLHNGYISEEYTAQEIVDSILSMQLADGGWALTGTVSDADVTAMTLQALAPYYAQHTEAIERAVSMLSERQLADGGYASYGVANPESTAQVITALSALGIDCFTDERFIKQGHTLMDGIVKYRLSDGSFRHTQDGTFNHNATVQVYNAMTAYLRQQNGWGSFYSLDSRLADAPTAEKPHSPISTKLVICFILAGAGGVVCLLLFLTKKRHPKNFITVLLLTAAGIGIVCVTDFQTAEEYYSTEPNSKDTPIGTVTMTIRCDTIANAGDADYIPKDGTILDVTEFSIAEGDTVFDILTEAARAHSIQLEYSGSADMPYITGIGYLYEFDFGELSGWVYHVNGASPSVGCGEYLLKDGDVIEWLYSCDLGEDVK